MFGCGYDFFRGGLKQIIAFLPMVFQDFVLPFLEEGFAWIEGLFALAGPFGTVLLSVFPFTNSLSGYSYFVGLCTAASNKQRERVGVDFIDFAQR